MDEKLSLEDAASLLSGASMDTTKALPGNGVPAFVMTDGSNGLAMNLPDFSGKVPATCFPTSSAMAATWDSELVERVAAAIAVEAGRAGAHVLLSPGMNIKRSPLGGRNFEYYSEDPLLTGRMAAAFVRGVQSTGLGACAKHFAVNNQETDRMRVSADLSERALREIYLPAFEEVVRGAQPRMVMASYNKVNGVYASESDHLLTTILREEWGFAGVVVSDWGAVDDRVRALDAGLDLEMPSTGGASDAQVVEAVADGRIDASKVHASASRVADLARILGRGGLAGGDAAGHDELAVEAARSAAVLLQNQDAALPIAARSSVTVIGAMAEQLRFQGGGSAAVNARTAPERLQDELARRLTGRVQFAAGYRLDGAADEELILEAMTSAAMTDVAVVVVGLPDAAESEGYDRESLDLPAQQIALIHDVAHVARRTVVVILSGGPVITVPWQDEVEAILYAGLAGQGVATALAEILTGEVSPSGHLAETWPRSLAQTPSFLSFPGEKGHSIYGEGVFVGYRGHDLLDQHPAFAFGHGLSYTDFVYSVAGVQSRPDGWLAQVRVANAGGMRGAAVIQAYVEPPAAGVRRPLRTLAGFAKVDLKAGESVLVDIELPRRAAERWDEQLHTWVIDAGTHVLSFGLSSRDLGSVVSLEIAGDSPVVALTRESTLSEWLDHPIAGPKLLASVAEADPTGATTGMLTNPHALLMIGGLPIHRLAVDSGNALTEELLSEISSTVFG